MSLARTPLVAGLISLAVTAATVLVGLATTGTSPTTTTPVTTTGPTEQGTPLASLDTATLVVERAAFCSGLGIDPVSRALGGDVATSSSYENGESAELTRKVTDVAHEFGCSWLGADGTTARAWVFAPPITVGQATDLVADAAEARGCTPIAAAPDFGSPSAGLVCRGAKETQAAYRGLFGDAWLSCSITASSGADAEELVDRTDHWCGAVATAASP